MPVCNTWLGKIRQRVPKVAKIVLERLSGTFPTTGWPADNHPSTRNQ